MARIKILSAMAVFCSLVTSCITNNYTAKTADIEPSIHSAVVADLKVSENRIKYTKTPTKEERRGGEQNVLQIAESEALESNGGGDLLVNPEFVVSKKRTFFGSKITSVTVTGRPAFYTNFRAFNDSVWSNPTFRGVKVGHSKYSAPKQKKASTSFSALNRRPTGFEFGVSLGYGGFSKHHKTNHLFEVIGTLGFMVHRNFYIGAGSGFQACDFQSVPVFANFRYYAGSKRFAPFVDFRVGYIIGTESNDKHGYWYYYDRKDYRENSPYLSPAIGLNYRFGKKMSVDIAYRMTFCDGGLETFANGVSVGFHF